MRQKSSGRSRPRKTRLAHSPRQGLHRRAIPRRPVPSTAGGLPCEQSMHGHVTPQAPASHGAPVTRVTQNAYRHRLGSGIQIRSLTLARPSIQTRQPRTRSSSRHLPRRAIELASSTTGIRRYASSSGSGLGCLLVNRWTTNPTGSPRRPAPWQRTDTSTTPRRLPEITCAPVQAASDVRRSFSLGTLDGAAASPQAAIVSEHSRNRQREKVPARISLAFV